MKIVRFCQAGPPSVLEYIDVPIPSLNDGEVLVRAEYIGVGIPDVLIRSGLYGWMPPLPAVPGTEMSGIIEKVGRGVTSLKNWPACRRLCARAQASGRLLRRVQCDTCGICVRLAGRR